MELGQYCHHHWVLGQCLAVGNIEVNEKLKCHISVTYTAAPTAAGYTSVLHYLLTRTAATEVLYFSGPLGFVLPVRATGIVDDNKAAVTQHKAAVTQHRAAVTAVTQHKSPARNFGSSLGQNA